MATHTGVLAKRRTFLVLLFIFLPLFFSSCATKCRQWELQDSITCTPCYNSARLVLPADKKFCSLAIIIERDIEGIRMYADTHVLGFPRDEDCCNTVRFDLRLSCGPPNTLSAKRLQGGQRLLFDEQTTDTIIATLLDDDTAEITIGQFHAVLIPDGFAELWCELMNLSVN